MTVTDNFHSSGNAATCPPDNSAHISAHNAARLRWVDKIEGVLVARHRAVAKQRLEENYKKAEKRAKKKGRTLPQRDDAAVNSWGYPYLMYGPWVYPASLSPGLYYGSDPAALPAGTGIPGACAGGTCGGTVAAGACGGAGTGQCAVAGKVGPAQVYHDNLEGVLLILLDPVRISSGGEGGRLLEHFDWVRCAR